MWRVDSLEKTLMLGGIGAGGEGYDRGWDGWIASLTWWMWVWVNSRSWWWTGRPGVLQFMGSQRVGHDWATELNWTELNYCLKFFLTIICKSKIYPPSWFAPQPASLQLSFPGINPYQCNFLTTFTRTCFIFHFIVLISSLKAENSSCSNPCMLSHFSCVQLCNAMDCSPPGSSVHGIL